MGRFVLHVGQSKAGSTTIQRFLGDNVSRLEQAGVSYPVLPMRRGQPAPQHSRLPRYLAARDETWTGFVAEVLDHSVAVISGEMLLGRPASEISTLKSALEGEAGATSFNVIVYVRNIADRLLSKCAQRAKSGVSYALTLAAPQPDLTASVSRYEEIFGAAAVDVRLLDATPDLVADFCEAAGLPPLDYVLPERSNVSADPITAQLYAALRTEFAAPQAARPILRYGPAPCVTNQLLRAARGHAETADLSHPKLARFEAELRSVRLRDETRGPDQIDYLNHLVDALTAMRDDIQARRSQREARPPRR